MIHSLSRRSFIKKTTMVGGALIMSNSLLGNIKMASPNERINLVCVGIGNRAAEIIKDLHKTGLCNVVGLCDVDLGAKHTLDILKLFPDAKNSKISDVCSMRCPMNLMLSLLAPLTLLTLP